MDEIVRQAMAKWPNVPHCFGWLALDQRGQWRMRDEATQRAGLPGTPIRHAALLAFIHRNYACDAHGQWFFQNGPQRVYVELAYTPWVLRLALRDGRPALTDQRGERFVPSTCLFDDAGYVLFAGATPADGGSPGNIGVLHDHDTALLADAANLDALTDWLDTGVAPTPPMLRWHAGGTLPTARIARADVPARFGFVPHPLP